MGLKTFYDYRTSAVQAQVEDLQKQREVTIKKLKAATKYDSTQELLKKYGGTPTPKPKPAGDSDRKVNSQEGRRGVQQTQRTGVAPPPTANIPGRQISSPAHGASQHLTPPRSHQQPSPLQQSSPQQQSPTAEFAPNAFPSVPQYASIREGPYWYDRLVDVLLGEDETLPGKRLALICNKCRLVNGQAPPGVKRLEDIGKWRCGGCGAMNGEENHVKNLVKKLKEEDVADSTSARKEALSEEGPASTSADEQEESDVTIYSEDEDNVPAASENPSSSGGEAKASTRSSKRLNKGKKGTQRDDGESA